MRPEFRFPRSTVLLMAAVLGGVVLAIEQATSIEVSYGTTLGTVWPALPWFYLLASLIAFAAAVVIWIILFALGRTGMHRIANMRTSGDHG